MFQKTVSKINPCSNVRATGVLSQRCFSQSYVNIMTKQDEYQFISEFLKCGQDEVKNKFPILRRYQMECSINPLIDIERLRWIQQKYELYPLFTESYESQIRSNDFISKMMNKIEKFPSKSLSKKQFEATRKKLRLWKFQKNIDQIVHENHQSIATLYRADKVDILAARLKTWCVFEYGSYGHPYIVSLYNKVSETSQLSVSEILGIMHYLTELKHYKYKDYHLDKTFKKYNEFLEAMKWFRKHNIKIQDDYFHIFDHHESLQNAMHLEDFWDVQTVKFQHLLCLVSDVIQLNEIDGLKEDDLMEYIGYLSCDKNDPFFLFLWNKLSGYGDKSEAKQLQRNLMRRWDLDHGQELIKDPSLIPRLYVEKKENIESEEHKRRQILCGHPYPFVESGCDYYPYQACSS